MTKVRQKEDDMKEMRRPVLCNMLLAIVAALQLCSSYALEMVTPKDGEVFCAHKPEHSRFLALSREERRRQFLDKEWRARIVREDIASSPVPLRLEWKDGEGPYIVTIELGGNTVFETNTVATFVDVYNLEIAREYAWTVRSGGECVRGKFRTSDLPPRIIYLPDVRNIRDMGGWTGLGGRKIRQGMVYRSGGLNFNAHTYYNCEETLAFYKAGVLEERFGEIGRKVKMQIDRDKGEFRFDPKAPFLRRSIIKEMHATGITVLLVEQNAGKALAISDRAYVLENGRIVLSGTGKELSESEMVKKAYLGG